MPPRSTGAIATPRRWVRSVFSRMELSELHLRRFPWTGSAGDGAFVAAALLSGRWPGTASPDHVWVEMGRDRRQAREVVNDATRRLPHVLPGRVPRANLLLRRGLADQTDGAAESFDAGTTVVRSPDAHNSPTELQHHPSCDEQELGSFRRRSPRSYPASPPPDCLRLGSADMLRPPPTAIPAGLGSFRRRAAAHETALTAYTSRTNCPKFHWLRSVP
jgi:hypothetical protein